MTLQEFVEFIPALVLIFSRMAGLFILAPVLGGAQVPTIVRVGGALTVSGVLAPFVEYSPAAIPADIIGYTAAVASETLIGLVLGFGATLLFTALQIAGEVIDIQMGFMVANVTDPQTNVAIPLMGQFVYLLAILVFLAVNGHHWLLMAMEASYDLIPLAGVTHRPGFDVHFTQMASDMFVRAVQFGAPVVAALILTEMAMGVVGRAVPQMNIMMLGFSIRIAIGFAVLWFVMATLVELLVVVMDRNHLFADLFRLVRGLGPPP
ncbi:MAG: flagellar type III secretion system protein FliR [Armatimonadia bacterium]|nr:flagellar type III secretion system protein FliR [Armatimonadia bacterium]